MYIEELKTITRNFRQDRTFPGR